MPAPVEMPHGGREVDSGGVDERFGQGLEIAVAGQQTSAYRSHFPVDQAAFDQLTDETGQQRRIRIQHQDPVAPARGDGLVLRGREPGIAVVVDDPDPALKSREDLPRAIGGRVVHHHYLERPEGLLEHGPKAGLDVVLAVVGNYSDAD